MAFCPLHSKSSKFPGFPDPGLLIIIISIFRKNSRKIFPVYEYFNLRKYSFCCFIAAFSIWKCDFNFGSSVLIVLFLLDTVEGCRLIPEIRVCAARSFRIRSSSMIIPSIFWRTTKRICRASILTRREGLFIFLNTFWISHDPSSLYVTRYCCVGDRLVSHFLSNDFFAFLIYSLNALSQVVSYRISKSFNRS